MDIYSIGEEKCIDGVWGREVNGRFYDWVSQNDGEGLYRKLDIDSLFYQPYAAYDAKVSLNGETVYVQSKEYLKAYTPKHIKDLENLKRGDIVWVITGGAWSVMTF
jgi:hypothetical protein